MVNATAATQRQFDGFRSASIETVIGVDFSGAALSGKTAWLAELSRAGPDRGDARPSFVLSALAPLGKLAGDPARDVVNRYLSDRMNSSRKTLWGCDFPFGLPIELKLGRWRDQLSHVRRYGESAQQYGLWLVDRTEQRLGIKHVRRVTDRETQTPFDCYHYRIIYQTFHGMRDVLAPVADHGAIRVLPFDYDKPPKHGGSIVLEACPSSTLKRLDLPHQLYKQSGGKPPSAENRRRRRTILRFVDRHVLISEYRRRVILNDPGGDALDAVLSGLGAWLGWERADHRAIAADRRYPREGYVYC